MTIVEGGGVVRVAGREYHAGALPRYDGRRVTVRPTADGAALEVWIDGRLLCFAGLIGPGDDDTGPVPAFVPRSPHDDGGSARLTLLPSESDSRWLGSVRSAVYAAPGLATAAPHHDKPRRTRSAREHRLADPRRSHDSDARATRIAAGSPRHRSPDVLTAPARGPPIVPSVPRTACSRRHIDRTTATPTGPDLTPPSPRPSRPGPGA